MPVLSIVWLRNDLRNHDYLALIVAVLGNRAILGAALLKMHLAFGQLMKGHGL